MNNWVAISKFAEVNPRTERPADNGLEVSFIPMSDVSESGQWTEKKTRKLSEVSQGFTAFKDGDVLFAKITPCMENGKGALVRKLKNGLGFGSTEFHVLRAKQGLADSGFIFHWLHYFDTREKARAFFTGSAGQQRVSATFFDNLLVPDFSVEEQRGIAEVLSALDEQIDAVGSEIMKQKSVLDGLLDRLLLDGLRDCKLGDYVEISPNINTQMPSQMTPFIPMESVSEDGHIYDWSFRPWSEVSSGFTRFSSGDVLVAKITPCFENGKGAQVPIGIPVGAGSTEFHVLRAKQGVCPRWIYWHTRVREFRIAGAGRMTGSAGQQRVPRDFIESFAVKSVSEKEQIEITACLDSVDVVIQLLIKEQEKLRLQKQGLMRDLLTGAVRVAGAH